MNDAIMVSGGAGFQGSCLCDRLAKAQRDVLCRGDRYTRHRNNIRRLLDRSLALA